MYGGVSIKKYIYFMLFIFTLFIGSNVFAFDCSKADQKLVFCNVKSNNLPYGAFVTIANSGEKIDMW